MLNTVVLYCIVLYCIVLYRIVMYCIVLLYHVGCISFIDKTSIVISQNKTFNYSTIVEMYSVLESMQYRYQFSTLPCMTSYVTSWDVVLIPHYLCSRYRLSPFKISSTIKRKIVVSFHIFQFSTRTQYVFHMAIAPPPLHAIPTSSLKSIQTLHDQRVKSVRCHFTKNNDKLI